MTGRFYFYHHGIEYKYECPLHLKDGRVVYPDFTFLSPRIGREIYWEHNGRVDDPIYARKICRRFKSIFTSKIRFKKSKKGEYMEYKVSELAKFYAEYLANSDIEIKSPLIPTFNVDAYDPFNDLYNYYDKEEKQKAMREVEEKFNCTIKYVTYPESAEYGSVRWNYLLDEINNKTVEYDFCAVPNFVIPDFVKNGSIINLNEYYLKYGQNIMNNVQVASSTYNNDVYAICDARKHSTMIMVYNLELFN